MKYKKSKYNIAIDTLEDGRTLIYNTFSGILGIMDLETQVLYDNIESIDIETIRDLSQKENVLVMARSGYIVAQEKDELATIKLERSRSKYGRPALSLTIAPTLACNMRCPYCYENKNGRVMTAEIQSKLVEFVEAQLNAYMGLHTLSVAWYGGEPLLQKATIYHLSEKFIQICEARDIKYDATVITNGALLDKETARKLRDECRVRRVQITIDGMPEQHNKRRIFADGTGSFDLIVKNIEDCREFMPISVRVNVDQKNVDEIAPLTKFLLEEKGWKDNPRVYIAPVENYDQGCKTSTCLQKQEFAQVKKEFQKSIYAINRELAATEFFPHRKTSFCGAECVNNYVIDPEGYYYNCWILIGEKEHASGHISKPFLVNSEYYKWISGELPKKCEECQYLPMCVGGCPYFRITNDGQPNCVNTFYSYMDTLRLAYHDYMEQKKEKNN